LGHIAALLIEIPVALWQYRCSRNLNEWRLWPRSSSSVGRSLTEHFGQCMPRLDAQFRNAGSIAYCAVVGPSKPARAPPVTLGMKNDARRNGLPARRRSLRYWRPPLVIDSGLRDRGGRRSWPARAVGDGSGRLAGGIAVAAREPSLCRPVWIERVAPRARRGVPAAFGLRHHAGGRAHQDLRQRWAFLGDLPNPLYMTHTLTWRRWRSHSRPLGTSRRFRYNKQLSSSAASGPFLG